MALSSCDADAVEITAINMALKRPASAAASTITLGAKGVEALAIASTVASVAMVG